MDLATGSNTSTAITANELQLRHADMQQRRQDRKRHYHSQIWTKDFHGGPYRKVRGRSNAFSGAFVPSENMSIAPPLQNLLYNVAY